MQTLRSGCRVGNDNAEKPDLYVTTDTLYNAFEETLHNQVRRYDEALAKAGFENILFGSAAVVADDRCTAGSVNAFRMNDWKVQIHEKYNFKPPVWKEPVNQEVKTCQIILTIRIGVTQRRSQGHLTVVT